MNGEIIKKRILDYIQDDSARYAVMIDGSWGSGKTYFYENELKDEISKNESGKSIRERKHNIYISLYGVDSIETLSKKLLTEIILSTNQRKKIGKALGVASEIATAAGTIMSASVAGLSFSFKDVESSIKRLCNNRIKPKNAVICFDDLERSTIPIPIVMGYINNLVEHCGCKVIVLADESNIGKVYANSNVEAKYQVVLSGRRSIKFLKDEKKNNNSDNHNSDPLLMSVDELKERSEHVFSDNYIYKDIKEKVIGRTFFYTPILDESFDRVVESFPYSGMYIDVEVTKEYLKTKRDIILEAFSFCGCNNMRILFTWLNVIPELFSCVEEHITKDNQKYIELLKEDVLKYSVCRICSNMANKKLSVEWDENLDFANTIGLYQYSSFVSAYAFGFVDEIVEYGVANDIRTSGTVKEYIKRAKRDEGNNQKSEGVQYAELLYSSWYFEDDELEKRVNLLLEEIDNGKYIFSDYRKVLWLFFILIKRGVIDVKLEDISKRMISSISRNNSCKQYYREQLQFSTEEDVDEFEKIYLPIEAEINLKIQDNEAESGNKSSIYESFDSFNDYIKEGRLEDFLARHGFFRYINIRKLESLTQRLNRKDFFELLRTIKSVYAFYNLKEFYANDIDALEEYRDWIEKSSIKIFEGKTGKAAKKYAIEILNELISRLD